MFHTCHASSEIIDWLLIYQFHTSSLWFVVFIALPTKQQRKSRKLPFALMSCNYLRCCNVKEIFRRTRKAILTITSRFSPKSWPESGQNDNKKKSCHHRSPIKRPNWSSFACLITLLEPHECKQQTTYGRTKKWFQIVSRKHGWVSAIKKVYMKKRTTSEQSNRRHTMEPTAQTPTRSIHISSKW